MSLGTVASLKGNALGYQPLFLVAITFNTGDQLLLSTHPVNSTEGGPDYPGNEATNMPAGSYLGRLQQQDFTALQQRSQAGIDRVTAVTLHIADPDSFVLSNYAFPIGFRGADVQVCLVMWQVGTSNFSSDAPIMFVGTCDQEVLQNAGNTLSVKANNGHNTATVSLPNFPILNNCPLDFPANLADRLATTDPNSSMCPYSPDITGVAGDPFHPAPLNGGVAVGNASGYNETDEYGNQVAVGNQYVICNKTRSDCMKRLGNAAGTNVAPDGDLMHDTSGRRTGAFAGYEWSPGTYYAINKTYTSGQQIATFSFLNSQVIGQYVPILYGTQWVNNAQPVVIIEDGNFTRCQVIVCAGEIGPSTGSNAGTGGYAAGYYGVLTVVVNGVLVPFFDQGNADNGFRWNWAGNASANPANFATGSRFGYAISDSGFANPPVSQALGDPGGSVANIEVCFYEQVFTGFGTPTINVLAPGPQVAVYTDQTTYTKQGDPYNCSPPWVLLDVLVNANWSAAEINMQSFIDADTFCQTQINYIDNTGATQQHARFKCSFCLQNRVKVSEVLAGILRSFNGYLYWGQDGLLSLGINRTLGDEQPSPITGSNYNDAVPTILADNSDATGYVAYSFSESDIIRKADGTPDIKTEAQATTTTPNQINIAFQDENNQWTQDSLQLNDTGAQASAGGALQPGGSIIPEDLNQYGISNFDQASRIGNVYLAERQRGNPRGDGGGTMVVTFATNVRVEHLRVGHLVLFSFEKWALTTQLMRVTGIAPTDNFESVQITLTWHEDEWYTDLYGQTPQGLYNITNRNYPQRAPNPWQPFSVANNSSGMFSNTEWNFDIKEIDLVQSAVGAASAPVIQPTVSGCPPMNHATTATNPPLILSVNAAVSSTGGSIPGNTGYMCILCAIDAGGNYSAPSNPFSFGTATGTNTNSVAFSNIGWQTGTAAWDLFVGTNQYNITHQLSGTGTPSTITLTDLPNFLSYAPPDLTANQIALQAHRVIHSGIIGTNIANVTSTGFTLPPAGGGATAVPTIDPTTGAITAITTNGIIGGFGGYGYCSTPAPTVVITGDGAGASATCVVTPADGNAEGNGPITTVNVTSSGSDYTLANTTISFIPAPLTNDLTGYYIMLIGRPGSQDNLPLCDFQIMSQTSNADGSTTLTLDRDPSSLLQNNDVISVMSMATIASATTIGDMNYPNVYNSGTGVINVDDGYLVRIIRGTGRYQVGTIGSVSADGTTYTMTQPWSTTPDGTSVFIVEEATFPDQNEMHAIGTSPKVEQTGVASINVSNYSGDVVLVQALIADPTNLLFSNGFYSPFRMLYLTGSNATTVMSSPN